MLKTSSWLLVSIIFAFGVIAGLSLRTPVVAQQQPKSDTARSYDHVPPAARGVKRIEGRLDRPSCLARLLSVDPGGYILWRLTDVHIYCQNNVSVVVRSASEWISYVHRSTRLRFELVFSPNDAQMVLSIWYLLSQHVYNLIHHLRNTKRHKPCRKLNTSC